MNRTSGGRLLMLVPVLALVGVLLAGPSAQAASGPSGVTIYDSTVSPLPANLPSVGFLASQASEFGDKVTFAGTARSLTDVTVTLSTQGCQSGQGNLPNCSTTPGATFSWPITFTIYGAPPGDAVGPVLAQVTQTFAIPYRPSADPVHCTGADVGKWFDAASATCSDGEAVNITFDFSSLNVTLPDTVIWGVAFNTTTWGYHPVGPSACSVSATGCPYDSLNVAVSGAASTGTDVDPNGVYWNSATPSQYCDNGSGGTNTFRLDTPCWTGQVPAARFGAQSPGGTTTAPTAVVITPKFTG